jgi:thiol-disulfide isomerase/thioredoxin
MIRKALLPILAAAALSCAARADDSPAPSVEQRLSDATKSPGITVVHLWAPWCPNCRAELANGEWSGFIASNPGVHFVFVTVWSPDGGRELLEKNGVGAQGNFELLVHPNGSRKGADRMTQLLGIPVSWIPTTWIFRDGRLCYAMNYGELRFPMLQQLIKDSGDSWER